MVGLRRCVGSIVHMPARGATADDGTGRQHIARVTRGHGLPREPLSQLRLTGIVQQLEEVPHGVYAYASDGEQRCNRGVVFEVIVAAHDHIRLSANRRFDHGIVIRISADPYDAVYRHLDRITLEQREQGGHPLERDAIADGDTRSGEHGGEFRYERVADDERETRGAVGRQYPRRRPRRREQGRYPNVRINDGAHDGSRELPPEQR